MNEYLIVFSTGGPDTFEIIEGLENFNAFLAECKRYRWPVRRTTQLTPLEQPVEGVGMTTEERQNLRIALQSQGLRRVDFTNDDGTGVYEETWRTWARGATVTIQWDAKRIT